MNSSTPAISRYTANHRQACIDAFISNIPRFFVPHELRDFEKWLNEEETHDPSTTSAFAREYFVAALDGRVIACGGYFVDLVQRDARMTWGLVHHNFHRRGIGSRLLLHRIGIIRSLYPAATISLDTTQHAYPFFEKLGFTVTAVTENFYVEGLHRYDMSYVPTVTDINI